ncbi:hypothetical protein ACOL22_05980 [Aliarcobacter butzleri]
MSKNKEIHEIIQKITKSPSNTLIIFYSHAKVINSEVSDLTPMLTTILVRSLDKKTYEEFSIYKEADKFKEIDRNTINENYTDLEHAILGNFNNFLKHHKNFIWIHWNMNNSQFGFEAIKHRFMKMVEGTSEQFEEIPTNNKIDLNYLIEQAYGKNYTRDVDKFKSLAKYNKFLHLDRILDLEDEMIEFNNKNFEAVVYSLEQKIDIVVEIIDKMKVENLKVPQKGWYVKSYDLVTHPGFGISGFLIGILGIVLSIVFFFLSK